MKKSVILSVLLFCCVVGSGCATLTGNKQLLAVGCTDGNCEISTGDDSGSLKGNGVLLVKRSASNKVINFKKPNGEIKTKEIQSSIRFKRSILLNGFLGLTALGPAVGVLGMIVDFSTGAMFEYQGPVILEDNDQREANKNILPDQFPIRIQIGPVKTDKLADSYAADIVLTNFVKREFPDLNFIEYDKQSQIFEDIGWTFKQLPDDQQSLKAVNKLSTSYFLIAEVVENDQTKNIKWELMDLVTNKVFRRGLINLNSISGSQSNFSLKSWFFNELAEGVPNSISLNKSSQKSYGFLGFDSYQTPASNYISYTTTTNSLVSSKTSDMIQSYNLGFENNDVSSDGEFATVAKISYSGDLGYQKSYIKTSAIQVDAQLSDTAPKKSEDFRYGSLTIYRSGFKLGPEIGLKGILGYLYFNLQFGFNLYHLDFSNFGQKSFAGGITSTELGWKYRLTKNFFTKLSFSLSSFDSRVVSEINKNLGLAGSNSPVYETSSVFGLSYYFPEAKRRSQKYLILGSK